MLPLNKNFRDDNDNSNTLKLSPREYDILTMSSPETSSSTRVKLFSFSLLALAVLQLKPDVSVLGNLRNKASANKMKKAPQHKTTKEKHDLSSSKKLRKSTRTMEKEKQHDTALANAAEHQIDLFDPDDLAGSKRVQCGWDKCFFSSKSNNQVGYLVARSSGMSSKEKQKRLKSLELAYQLAKHLEQEYNIQHFLMDAPFNITVTQSMEARMNSNLKSETGRQSFNNRRFPKGSTAFVEKVKPAPKHTLLIGCKSSKLNLFNKVVDKFIQRVQDTESFARQFKAGFAKLRELLVHEPCLLDDFQVIIDAKGNLYHLDFDRCFSMKYATKKRVVSSDKAGETKCYKSLDKIERRVYQAIKKVSASNTTTK